MIEHEVAKFLRMGGHDHQHTEFEKIMDKYNKSLEFIVDQICLIGRNKPFSGQHSAPCQHYYVSTCEEAQELLKQLNEE